MCACLLSYPPPKPAECQFQQTYRGLVLENWAQNKTGDDRWTSWSTRCPPPPSSPAAATSSVVRATVLHVSPCVWWLLCVSSSTYLTNEHISICSRQVARPRRLFLSLLFGCSAARVLIQAACTCFYTHRNQGVIDRELAPEHWWIPGIVIDGNPVHHRYSLVLAHELALWRPVR